jgi:cell wall-associated NlpC family hydrolase
MANSAIPDAVLGALRRALALYGADDPQPSHTSTAMRDVADALRSDQGVTHAEYQAQRADHTTAADKHADHDDHVRAAVAGAATGTDTGRRVLAGLVEDYQSRMTALGPIADTRVAGAALLDVSHASISTAAGQVEGDIASARATAAKIEALLDGGSARRRNKRKSRRLVPANATGHGRALGSNAVAAASGWLGTPHVWGGGGAGGPSAGGFDGAGLTQYAIAQATQGQLVLPRTSYDQIRSGIEIPVDNVRPGDLVFPLSDFTTAGPGHVQLAAGDGMVIEAPRSGADVQWSAMPAHAVVVRVL